MEEIAEFRSRLTGAMLQVKACQRACRTTLGVLNELESWAEELRDLLVDAESKEDMAHEHDRSNKAAV